MFSWQTTVSKTRYLHVVSNLLLQGVENWSVWPTDSRPRDGTDFTSDFISAESGGSSDTQRMWEHLQTVSELRTTSLPSGASAAGWACLPVCDQGLHGLR